MKRNHTLLFYTALLLVLMLPGCFIPEKFESSLHVNEDGSYIFKFDGSVAYAPALQKINESKLTENDEKMLQEMTTEEDWPPEFKKISYTGRARYNMVVEKQGKAGEDYIFMTKDIPVIMISHDADGTLHVKNRNYKKDMEILKKMGVEIDGRFKLSVGSGVKVLENNAQKTPTFFGLFGGYEWAFKSLDDKLMIRMALPQ